MTTQTASRNPITALFKSIGTSLRLLTYNKVGFIDFLAVVAIVLLSYLGPLVIPLDTKTKIGPWSSYWPRG